MAFDIIFTKLDSENKIITNRFPMKSKAVTIHNKSEIKKQLRRANEQLKRRIDRFTNGGSGWTIEEIQRHYLDITRHRPLAARSYIPLPDWIQNRNATINIKNTDDKCFIYCLARVLDPNPEKKNFERVSKHLKKVCIDLNLLDI